jgi:8-oxo-dGTP diphosphatase
MKKYNVDQYPPMFNTVDIALFSIIDNELGVMLIKRAEEPFKDCWALPGGYVDVLQDEDALKAAERELKEETNLDNIYLEQLYTFTKKGRDPREEMANRPCRIFSIAHFALIDYQKVKAIAGSDAKEVGWFKISKLPKLSFDHAQIIETAVNRIRNKINYTNVGFELVPKKFTIPELREVFEKVLGRELNPTNFRTKLLKLGLLKDTGLKKVEGRGQPAPIYELNRKKIAILNNGETLFN